MDKNSLSHHERYSSYSCRIETTKVHGILLFAGKQELMLSLSNNVINAFITALLIPLSTEIVTPGKSPVAGV